jgi:hypothetical protein
MDVLSQALFDPMPVFKIFTPEGSATWLPSETRLGP